MTRCATLPPCTAEAAAHHGLAAIRDWLELASFAATTIGVVFLMAGAVFAASQLREATKVRRAQLYTDIRNRWIARDLRMARKLVKGLIAGRHQAGVVAPVQEAAYTAMLQDGLHLMHTLNELRAENSADFEVALRIPSFIEDVGVLCRRGISIPEDVFDPVLCSTRHHGGAAPDIGGGSRLQDHLSQKVEGVEHRHRESRKQG